ncbi:transglutaminase domain-containing protein [Paenibacillus faecalis]|uniref:transglutaminase domain-containing protein n=1 Tax=Paenibacillus faecalis TaxID=2079532 RepID=UPI000D1060BF|nr:transglutaminase domain-containing protein [Paenibacillus faecalis]
MKRSRSALIKLLLVGSLAVTVAAIPESVEFNKVYAESNMQVVKSIDQIQQTLITAMNNRQTTVRFVYEGQTNSLKTQLKEALEQAMVSDPYIHYTIASYSYDYRGTSSAADVTVRLTYRETASETEYVNKRVKSILDTIIKPGMNDHEKVKAINDWVVLNLEYDTSFQKYTAYDGLSTGSTVCQGYSLLTYKMLKEAGIPNKIVEGTAYPEGNPQGILHAWNLVLLDGEWYHLDTTWNDPVPDRKGKVSYNYYLRTDEQMRKDHTWTKPYPAANTTYHSTLQKLASQNSSESVVYRKMMVELEYHLYDHKEVVRSYSDLSPKVRAANQSGNKELVFRFDGKESDLLKVLQDLQLSENIGAIRYYHGPFENTDDLKVHISW